MMAPAMTIDHEAGAVPVDRAPRTLRLGVVEQLLGDLDTATVAGRHFTMEKVVGLLRVEIGAAEPGLSEGARCAIAGALDELAREESHLLPDPPTFVARTRMITQTLALI